MRSAVKEKCVNEEYNEDCDLDGNWGVFLN